MLEKEQTITHGKQACFKRLTYLNIYNNIIYLTYFNQVVIIYNTVIHKSQVYGRIFQSYLSLLSTQVNSQGHFKSLTEYLQIHKHIYIY